MLSSVRWKPGALHYLSFLEKPHAPQPLRFSLANLLMLCTLLWLIPFKAGAQSPQPAGIAVGGDNLTRLLWNNPDSTISLWTIAADGSVATQNSYGPYAGYTASLVAAGPNSIPLRTALARAM